MILIILAVMANTMAMSARERVAEYATLKALGFGPGSSPCSFSGSPRDPARAERSGIAATSGRGGDLQAACRRHLPDLRLSPVTLACRRRAPPRSGSLPRSSRPYSASRVRIVEGLRAIG